MQFLNETEEAFWAQITIGMAVKGYSAQQAAQVADAALEEYRSRQPEGGYISASGLRSPMTQ